MDKRNALDIARVTLVSATTQREVPSDHPIRAEAASQGYHYLRIAVTNMDTDITHNFYTMRPHHGYGPFINDLIALAEWPGELLERLSVQVSDDEIAVNYAEREIDETTHLHTSRIYSPFSTEPIHERGTHSARLIADKQLLGGRPKQKGLSPEKAEEYRTLADYYHKSKLSQRDFCIEARVSRRKLGRALKYVSQNAP